MSRTRDELIALYATATTGFMADTHAEMIDSGMGLLNSYLEMGLIRAEGDAILDFGCGNGRLAGALELSGRNHWYCGLDCDPTVVDWCRRAFPQHLFSCTQMFNAAYAPEQTGFDLSKPQFVNFDAAVLSSVLTHCADRATAQVILSYVYAALKPGGRLWVTFFASPPNEPCADAWRTVLPWREILELLRGWTILWDNGCGMTDATHDQLGLLLEKPKA